MPNRERCKAYYERTKADPEKWASLQKKRREYMRSYRASKRAVERVITSPERVITEEVSFFDELTLDTSDGQD